MRLEDVKDWVEIVLGCATLVGMAINLRNVRKIEVATNSMKDELVKATAKAHDLVGEKRGREQEIARQAEVKP